MADHYDPYDYVLRLDAHIVGIDPPIARTLELPRELNFAQLHEVLQAAFGWTDSHLHLFTLGGLIIGAPEALDYGDDAPKTLEAKDLQLKDLSFPRDPAEGLEALYTYDFGDDWQHRLTFRRGDREESVTYPRCVSGTRASPPEDVGGYHSYGEFLASWLDPSDDNHKDNRRWAGRAFDPERFDLSKTNKAIAKALRLCKGDYRQRQFDRGGLP